VKTSESELGACWLNVKYIPRRGTVIRKRKHIQTRGHGESKVIPRHLAVWGVLVLRPLQIQKIHRHSGLLYKVMLNMQIANNFLYNFKFSINYL
jgi:hypothetical protein